MSGDGQVAGGVGDAGQDKAILYLAFIKEGLVALVCGAIDNLARAAGARASAATVWKIQSCLLRSVKDVHVVCEAQKRLDTVVALALRGGKDKAFGRSVCSDKN